MNFCTLGVIFIWLATYVSLSVRYGNTKLKEMWRFLCADMVDFRRPDHICHHSWLKATYSASLFQPSSYNNSSNIINN